MPRTVTLREWAYAGFTFDLLGAVISHLASHDGVESVLPLILLAAVLASYVLSKRREQTV